MREPGIHPPLSRAASRSLVAGTAVRRTVFLRYIKYDPQIIVRIEGTLRIFTGMPRAKKILDMSFRH